MDSESWLNGSPEHKWTSDMYLPARINRGMYMTPHIVMAFLRLYPVHIVIAVAHARRWARAG